MLQAMPRRLRPVFCLLSLVLAACVGQSDDSSPPMVRETTYPVVYGLSIDGALRLEGREPGVEVRILSVNDDRFPQARVFSLASDWVSGPQGRAAMLFSFDGYAGDGTYSISPAGVADGANIGISEVSLRYERRSGSRENLTFSERLSPCSVELEREGLAGRISCERLGDGNGAEVSVEATWVA